MTSFELSVPEPATGGVVTIGNFDGVHRGHQAMLQVVRELADRGARPTVVVTFDPHPITVLKPHVQLPRLSTIERRTELLRQHGADHVVVLPVSSVLLNMSPEEFFQKVIIQKLRACALVEGPDFCFGKDRRGNTDVLRQLCAASQLELCVIEPVRQADHMISSTRIRRFLQQGKIVEANELLGHSYSISGIVKPGAQRGRQLGFPTANLSLTGQMLPAEGVYAGNCNVAGQDYPAAVSIGPNPTFADNDAKVECHLHGFAGDLYGHSLVVELLGRVRGLQTFGGVEELIQQIRDDVAVCVATWESATRQ